MLVIEISMQMDNNYYLPKNIPFNVSCAPQSILALSYYYKISENTWCCLTLIFLSQCCQKKCVYQLKLTYNVSKMLLYILPDRELQIEYICQSFKRCLDGMNPILAETSTLTPHYQRAIWRGISLQIFLSKFWRTCTLNSDMFDADKMGEPWGGLPKMVYYIQGGMRAGDQPEIINKCHCQLSPSQHLPIHSIGMPKYI